MGEKATETDFYQTTPLAAMTEAEWEALCDGCGRCCYRTFLTGRGKRTRLHHTRIACDLLDLRTQRCTAYHERFSRCKDCTRLTVRNVGRCDWLPETCAYRRLYYKQPLPAWHPLVTGSAESVAAAGVRIAGGVHDRDVDAADWERYELALQTQ